ncbi:helix-turn-helix transcriptional regulator [Pengzhenrongella sicca]|uniref:AAA family ATPase n=1 Tax=Pengzhenrongella sicca TaxID=2819238 RepID=A0A8A4Z7T3_9MICO|nr:LuxR family transcriptional regulator [Pengzhenrongella sicca]QTE27970.1 AAA family ATPase [Pengzhenrongella sicca]
MPAAEHLLGRAGELARLDLVLGGASDCPSTLLVLGDPGIGKSALIAQAARRAAARGAVVLTTTGVPSEARLPFAGLHQLLGPVLPAAARLPRPQRDALLAAFGRSETAVGDIFAVALAALSLLRDCAGTTRVVLVAEDLHWIDRATTDVLAFVARRIDADAVAIVASAREAPRGAMADVLAEVLTLGGLDDVSAGQLVDASAPGLDAALRGRLLREAHGNPLALVELSIAWSRLPPGTLIASWVPVTTRLAHTFAARIDQLPGPCRTAVLVAALNDGPSLWEVLTAASLAVGAPLTSRALEPAIEARLVELAGGDIRFRHPLMRFAIAEGAALAERQDAHSALARVLPDADRVAWHRAAAASEPDEDVAIALDGSAARARRRGAVGVAVASLERGARLSPEPSQRGRRLVRAAELAFELGRRDVVQRLLDEAEQLPLDPLDRIRLQWRRGLGDGRWRDVAQTRSLAELVDRMHRAGELDLALDALLTVAIAGWWTSADDERRATMADAVDRLGVPDSDARVLGVLAFAAPVERGTRVLAVLRRVRAEELDDPGELSLLGAAAGVLGAQELSAAFLDPAIRRLRAQDRLGGLADALISRAWAAWHLGGWDLAASAAAETVRIGVQIERPAAVAAGRLVDGALAAARGAPAVADAIAADVEATFRPLGATSMLALATVVRGLAAQADGRAGEAYDLLLPLLRGGDDGARVIVGQAGIAVFVDAAVQCGELASARAVVHSLGHLAARCGSPTMSAHLAYARPLLADDDEAEDLFVAALGSGLAAWPFLDARLLLAYGSWLRRQRRVGESRIPLRAAREAFDALAADPWGERARQELRATGESAGPRAGAAHERLTAQEREIAGLAARGMTNREIGQHLYLSPRTVGSHLYHVFPKLGITSRAELAGLAGLPGLSGRPESA